LTERKEVNMKSTSNAETLSGKEPSSMAYEDRPKTAKGGRGAVNRFPLSPALEVTTDLDNLYKAAQEVRKEVNWKDSVLGFQANVIVNIIRLKNQLRNGIYKLQKCKRFPVFEPKKRDIEATRQVDRVVQRSLCNNYLYRQLTKHFIHDNAANQKGKGTDFARNRFKCLLHRFSLKNGNEGYCAYIDIHSFLRFHTARCCT